jgi:hypothetical protein
MASTTLLSWVQNNGFNPFNLVHCTGYFDINLHGALGPDPPPFMRAAFKHIGSSSTNIPYFIEAAYVHISENNIFTSIDDFLWKESTNTLPSGRHLGIYLTLIMTFQNKQGKLSLKDTKGTNKLIQQKTSDILHAIHSFMEAVSCKGYLKHWTKVVNVMI